VAAAVVALAAGALVGGGASGPTAAAHGRAGSGRLQGDFAAAAREFHVPAPVLLGVAYLESRWDGHAGGLNTDGGYGLMDLTDVTPAMFAARGSGMTGRAELAARAAAPALHTLAAAARLTGASAAELRTDDRENLRGGAALLASYERSLTGRTPADPAAWYGAVAAYSRSGDRGGAERFADEVYHVIASGAHRTTATGQSVRLPAVPGLRPDRRTMPRLRSIERPAGAAECPASLRCSIVPAAYENYQRANRPYDGLAIRYIVIHDTETDFDTAIRAFENPAGAAAANYVMRSFDGAITQMVPDRDLAFHTGNYWFNMHSVGIEHEGFAARGASWYTEAQYRATAALVRYLAARYRIPLDRQHVIGHDDVPGASSDTVATMHWDPGPYWDWNHFMALLGAPTAQPRRHTMPAVGSAVTIAPDFARNRQTVQVCGRDTDEDSDRDDGDDQDGDDRDRYPLVCDDQRQPANFLYVRIAPRSTAPLYRDPALHPGGRRGTLAVDDWGDTVSAGQQFVVAGRSGGWTAIWYGGARVWFANPGGVNTVPARGVVLLTPRAHAAPAPVYGQGYPRPGEYPYDLTPSDQSPLSWYDVPAGQAYVATSAPVRADDFSASDPSDTVTTGSDRYWVVQYDHRLALLNAADVTERSA
jgi:N-acetyl-anhydromuramyl-L-alanine amidase AmpD